MSSLADSDSSAQSDFGTTGPDPSHFLPFSFFAKIYDRGPVVTYLLDTLLIP